MTNALAARIIEHAQDAWARDPRARGSRPASEYIGLQLHFHAGYGNHAAYWHAACVTRPPRLPNRWHGATGSDPRAALTALAREIGMRL